jgi:hypothetical protein
MPAPKSPSLLHRSFFYYWLVATLAVAGASLAENKGAELLAEDHLGGIKIGLGEKQLAAILGKSAVKKGKPALEGATGEFVQTWTCAEKGLSIQISSGEKTTGPKRVVGFTAKAKCPLATAKGIKIGSTKEEVLKAYGAFEDKESKDFIKPGTFVAGSIYGGIIFSFGKDGKVREIFFGAAAE